MVRTAKETANALIGIYGANLSSEDYNHFRISWSELRSIANVSKLLEQYLREVNQELNKFKYTLVPLDNCLVVAQECDFSHIRFVPPRLVEQFIPGDKDVDDCQSAEAIQPKWKPRFRMRKALKSRSTPKTV